MWLIKFAWKNLWRNKSRTLITLAAIFFAVVLSITAESLKRGVFDNLVKNVVSFYTGYIQVHQKGYYEEQMLDNSFKRSLKLEGQIQLQGNINALAPRLEVFALASSGNSSKGCMVAGIDPGREDEVTSLRNKLVGGDYLVANDKAVLLGEGLSQRLQLTTGDTIMLIGQGYHGATAAGKFRIKGILKFGSPQLNDRMLYMDLPSAQELFSAPELITTYAISLDEGSRLDQTAASIKQGLGKDYEVMTWEELLPDIRQHIATDSNNMKIVQGVLYLLVCFGIFSTLLMMMVERKFEMGMLVAIGMKKSRLARLFIIESVLTVVIGCLSGILASLPLVYYLKIHPIRLGGDTAKAYERFGFEAIFPTSTDPDIFIYQGMTVLILGLLLSFYPVWKVIRVSPVNAMKR